MQVLEWAHGIKYVTRLITTSDWCKFRCSVPMEYKYSPKHVLLWIIKANQKLSIKKKKKLSYKSVQRNCLKILCLLYVSAMSLLRLLRLRFVYYWLLSLPTHCIAWFGLLLTPLCQHLWVSFWLVIWWLEYWTVIEEFWMCDSSWGDHVWSKGHLNPRTNQLTICTHRCSGAALRWMKKESTCYHMTSSTTTRLRWLISKRSTHLHPTLVY